jgi:hypothetical protein
MLGGKRAAKPKAGPKKNKSSIQVGSWLCLFLHNYPVGLVMTAVAHWHGDWHPTCSAKVRSAKISQKQRLELRLQMISPRDLPACLQEDPIEMTGQEQEETKAGAQVGHGTSWAFALLAWGMPSCTKASLHPVSWRGALPCVHGMCGIDANAYACLHQ